MDRRGGREERQHDPNGAIWEGYQKSKEPQWDKAGHRVDHRQGVPLSGIRANRPDADREHCEEQIPENEVYNPQQDEIGGYLDPLQQVAQRSRGQVKQ